MKFIVIEGLDGSGKSTQLELVKEYFQNNNIKYKYLHFPRTDTPVYGDLISKFLRGDLGNISQVSPYLVALIYAGDRDEAKNEIINWLNDGYYVICDRYVYSNIAFQCAKVKNFPDKKNLYQWIKMLEFEYFSIPVPDIGIFLDMPLTFVEKQLSDNRVGEDRDYLNGKADIHEADINFQKDVRNTYLWQIEKEKNFQVLNCSKNAYEAKSKEDIFEEIVKILKHENILK